MASLTVNLVVACTDKKLVRPKAELQLRRYRGIVDLAERADAWVAALRKSDAPYHQAADLYLGDHWQVARALRDSPPRGVAPRLWVMSAGYGLVDADGDLHPYSATFATGHEDSVVTGGEEQSAGDVSRAWWDAVTSEWARVAAAATWRVRASRSPKPGAPHSLAELAEEHPATPMFVVGSAAYLGAVADDLLVAASALRSRDLLSVFSTGDGHSLRALEYHRVLYDGRLQSPNTTMKRPPYLRGAYPSLNIRAAGEALGTAAKTRLRCPALQQHFAELMESQPALRRYDRARAQPDEVAAFIRQALAKDPATTHTRLLRAFRDGGRAFEYTRFRGVFEQVKGEAERGRRERVGRQELQEQPSQ